MKQLLPKVSTLVLGAVLAVATAAAMAQQATNVRIYANPDIRISYDGNVPHQEAPITASATDANLLYAGTEIKYPGRFGSAPAAQLYYSHDQGTHWYSVLLPAEITGGWDNAAAAGEGGTDYFITHNFRTGLDVYTTHDGGLTWTSSFIPPRTENGTWGSGEGGWDREYAVVDTTHGPYNGRLYVAGEGHLKDLNSPLYTSNIDADGVKVVSSSDGGKTFSDPAMACHRPGWHTNTKPRPVVLSDGTLVLPCAFYPPLEVMQVKRSNSELFGVVSSSDGGKTFSPFHSIGDNLLQYPPAGLVKQQLRSGSTSPFTGVAYDTIALAAAPKTGSYPNRLYIAWPTFDSASREVVKLSFSDDRGVTWSAPKAVYPVPYGQQPIREALPMVAVNKKGIVGIAWFDGRNASGAYGYDIYFTSSVDGGASFLPPVRLTSVTSYPVHDLNIAPEPILSDESSTDILTKENVFDKAAADRNNESVRFTTAYHGRPLGGDYSTMAVDAAGAFHPMWPDARDGAWQLYTTTIRVISPSEIPQAATAANLHSCVLGSHMKLILGAPQVDASTKGATYFVRLENISHEILVRPLSVRITTSARRQTVPPGEIFDAATGKFSTSTAIVYPVSVDRPVFPNGTTVPEMWRLSGIATLNLRVTISGASQSCTAK